jgi:hypothetical protein
MKVHIDIDCTPEEARTFLGLPDVAPMQAAIMEQLQQRMLASLEAMAPEALIRQWLPAQMDGWERFQKALWSTPASAGADEDKREKP